MRKAISILLFMTILIFIISACGLKRIKIEDYEWKMRTIVHTEDNQLVYDAVSKENATHPEARIINMMFVAKDGEITITNVTDNKTYKGTYVVTRKTLEETNYEIYIDGKLGYATVAMTTYADGIKEPTLPISFNGYSLYFYAE